MEDIELIKQKLNIVDVVQEYLPLKKAGINFKANCPFHQERTPSFVVSPERGIWHCFGCQKGGDAFNFLMEKEGIEFKDALEILAKKAGVVLKKTPTKDKDIKERLFELHQKAQQYFHYILTEHKLGKDALEYLKKRGVVDKTIKEFGLGYAPLSWESLALFLKKRGFSYDEMVESGLVISSKRGGYDRFRGRVMFPLMDVRDRVLGFSGRVLRGGEPKYINSPQTKIFDKSKFLFGIQLSKGEIRQKNEAILVEGEMDMILSFQSGIQNIVASKGTALTDGQIDLIKKYCENITLCFDADLAGDFASRRGIEMADKAGLNIRVIPVAGVKDPADMVKEDPKKWEQVVKDAVPIYDYYLSSASKRYNLKDASAKKAIFKEILPIWQKISDSLVKEHYIQKLAALLQIKDDFIRQAMNKPQPSSNVSNILEKKKDDHITPKDRRRLLEEYLLALLVHPPEGLVFVPNFPETLFTEEHLRQIYVLLVLYFDSIAFQTKVFKISDFVNSLPVELTDEVDRLYLVQIDEKLFEVGSWQKELETVKVELKKLMIKTALEELSLRIKNAQEFDRIDLLEGLNRKFRDLSIKLKNL